MTVVKMRLGPTIALLGTVAVLATACGGGTSTGSSSSSSDSSALGTKKAATGSEVKIGLFNVEGGSAVSLPGVGDAAQAAASYANDYLGGLGGHKITIVRCADKADGASAAACANQFVQTKVAAVVAGQPATADQLVPVISGANIPYFGSSPAAPTEIGDPNAYFFSSGFIGLLGAEAVYAKEKGYKSFTMFGAENPQLVAAVNGLGKPLFKGQGVTLDFVPIPQGTADATSQVTAGMTKKPDAVAIVADTTVCQSVLSALTTVGSSAPKLVNSACIAKPVLDAVGASGMDKTVLFNTAATTGSDAEAKLYQAILKQYAPKADPSGITAVGYLSMLGFIRAANSGSLGTGDLTSASILTAVKGAKNVPLPVGDGQTFSCDAPALTSSVFKATICNGKFFVSTYKGLTPGPAEVVDAAPAFGG